jgi:hypothetical protein
MALQRLHGGWQRTSKRRPCPICGKPDWCSVSEDGCVVVCMRARDDSRFVHDTANGGYLHRLGQRPCARPVPQVWCMPLAQRNPDPTRLMSLSQHFQQAVPPGWLRCLSADLGVTEASLRRLGVGWDCGTRAWSFPMCDHTGRVLGIRLRSERGRKFSVSGGREGLFIPACLPRRPAPLAFCEGPTDAAALLDLGVAAVGRPSCVGGAALAQALVKAMNVQSIVVLGDNDGAGLRGAEAFVDALTPHVPVARLLFPPRGTKDVRAWVGAGATPGVVQTAIEAAPRCSMKITSRHSLAIRRKGGASHGR